MKPMKVAIPNIRIDIAIKVNRNFSLSKNKDLAKINES